MSILVSWSSISMRRVLQNDVVKFQAGPFYWINLTVIYVQYYLCQHFVGVSPTTFRRNC